MAREPKFRETLETMPDVAVTVAAQFYGEVQLGCRAFGPWVAIRLQPDQARQIATALMRAVEEAEHATRGMAEG